ncbi:MAG: AAA family ATPase [Verrucomicrobiota bacterium]
MLQNHTTPRIFIAATRQNDGKTTTAVGMYSSLRERFNRVGYIKPIGQRFVEISGKKIDEDTVLINNTYHPGLPLEAMSPIAVDPWFTRYYLDKGDPAELKGKVETAFNRASWEQDFVVIEGSGHAGVGSVFNMSNAHVAQALQSKAIIVSRGGIGKPLDEISLNLALFEKYGVEVIGVIFNQVQPDKIDSLRHYAKKGVERLGVELLGIIPTINDLRKPTFGQICTELGGRWISGSDQRHRRVGKVAIAASSPDQVGRYLAPEVLLVSGGDRVMVLDHIADNADQHPEWKQLAGLVLTSGIMPDAKVLKRLQDIGVPILLLEMDAFTVATRINRMTVKTEPGDQRKIDLIQDMIREHVDVDRIVEVATSASQPVAAAAKIKKSKKTATKKVAKPRAPKKSAKKKPAGS